MALYLVSYDLLNHATFGQYETLIAELRRIGSQRVLLSEWVVRREEGSEALRDRLRAFILCRTGFSCPRLPTIGPVTICSSTSTKFRDFAKTVRATESSSLSGSKCSPACHQ